MTEHDGRRAARAFLADRQRQQTERALRYYLQVLVGVELTSEQCVELAQLLGLQDRESDVPRLPLPARRSLTDTC